MNEPRKTIGVHPNSTAARKWGKGTWTSHLTRQERQAAAEARPRTAGGSRFTSQAEARSVPCPVCKAPLGQHCTGRRGPRIQQHELRHIHALNAGAIPAGKRTGQRNRRAQDKRY